MNGKRVALRVVLAAAVLGWMLVQIPAVTAFSARSYSATESSVTADPMTAAAPASTTTTTSEAPAVEKTSAAPAKPATDKSTTAKTAKATTPAAQQMGGPGPQPSRSPMPMRATTQAQRKAAAANRKAAVASVAAKSAAAAATTTLKAGLAPSAGTLAAAALALPAPGATPDYFGPYSNWANSPLPSGPIAAIAVTNGGAGYTAPVVTITDIYLAAPVPTTATLGAGGAIASIAIPAGNFTAPVVNITDPTGTDAAVAAKITPLPGTGLRKFMDTLPSLTLATPDTVTYPGSDYYEIELVEYRLQMHADLPPVVGTFPNQTGGTTLRGYKQTNNGTDGAGNNTVVPPATPSYLGPTIVATRDRPVRIKFTNNLPIGTAGDLFIPTDVTMMGAGSGYDVASGTTGTYTQNRGTLHLHGGVTPWISDGTPHQWVVPAAETGTILKQGDSTQPVPDMPLPAGGSMTFYYTNQQSGRLMFYHDHAYGITRLNVYAGEASGYLLVDPVERALTDGTTAGVPAMADVPLVIQDKSFVWGTPPVVAAGVVTTPGTGTWATDPTWRWGQTTGSLWFPHVYIPNQNPWDPSGANAMGRWDYALWFWPPYTGLIANGLLPNPYYDPIAAPWEPPSIPGTPNPSLVPEAFMDTPLVNGKAYPTMTVPAGPVRLRILNASNDRFQNLSLFVAADKTTPTTAGALGVTTMCTNNATVLPANCTEVKMVPFNSSQNQITQFPSWWYTPALNFTFDDREGGVPDPTTRGPAMIQIGSEGGILPAPAVIRNQPINFTYNRRNIVVLSVEQKALMLGPAERADVIVDFSGFAGKTLILYNDAPAPVPAADQRIDYFTGNEDQTDTGGAPPTLPGYGPNTRTILQIVVGGSGGTAGPDAVPAFLPALNAALPAAFAASQDPIVVPQAAYNAAYGTATTDVVGTNLSSISATSLTFTPLFSATPLTLNMGSKAIQELFELDYGRMNATLGVELPFTNAGNQTTIPLGYTEPPTEIIDASAGIAPPSLGDGTQIWKITHNGVDTHAIHVHLFNVQVINRVGWDGAIRPPDANELGWKETVRMNPLEDIIVALRPATPLLPFGVPESVRLLDVTKAPGTLFPGLDPLTGGAVSIPNELTNFGWEYVWHCHLLGHEENDMMRPTKFNVVTALPGTPDPITVTPSAGHVTLSWTDATPVGPNPAVPANLGNPSNEIGFRIEYRPGTAGAWTVRARALANSTGPVIDTVPLTPGDYQYRVVAYNASGDTASVPFTVLAGPLTPTNFTLTVVLVSGTPRMRLTWTNGATAQTGVEVWRAVGAGTFSRITTTAAAATGYTDTSSLAATVYHYYLRSVRTGTTTLFSAPTATLTGSTTPILSAVTPNQTSPYPASGFSPITWTATSSGGIAPVQYQFSRRLGAGAATIVQTWSTSNTFTWTPTTAQTGTWTIIVTVRNAGATASQGTLTSASFVLTAYAAPTVTGLSANGAAVVGSPNTWTATATGGAAPLQYQFWRYSYNTGVWSMVQASTVNTYTWTPAGPDIGNALVEVLVRSAGSTAGYEAFKVSSLFAVSAQPPTITLLSASPGSPVPASTTPVIWSVSTTGGVAPLQYQFWQYSYTTGVWTMVQAYSTSSTYSFIPSTPGNYLVEVLVRNSGSTAPYDAFAVSSIFVVQ
jgi:FtsP/CotA-like multicopper oxidase with cupredoxin domain